MKAKFPPQVVARVKSVSMHVPQKSAIVETRVQLWNRRFQKFFTFPKHFHISDPTGAVRKGDTVAIARWPSIGRSKRLEYTVTQIVAAAGADGQGALSLRPKVMSEEERREQRKEVLLRTGGPSTVKGLRSGELYIGEEGKVLRRGMEKEKKVAVDEMEGVK
jgi:ribosomal protein S17